MNHHNPRPEAVDLSSGGALCVCLDASASGWTVLEARDHDDLMLTRFVPNHFDGAMALKKANLRGPQRVPVAVGVYAHSLVLSMRLKRCAATPGAVDGARAELLRFAAACGCL